MEMPESVNPEPIVTVCIFAYNHEAYIRQAVESVLMQQTSFAFDILIGEDGSSDNTPDILRQLQAQHPDRIQILFQDQSKKIYINGRPTGRYNFITTLQTARGRYIALLDGDDYWTDPLKLQKQVDFLEREPEYVLTCHDASMVDEQGKLLKSSKLPDAMKRDFSTAELRQGPWILTLSVCFRNVLQSFPPEMLKVLNGDTFLLSLLGQHGGAKYLPHISPATYRVHSGGIWSQEDGLRKLRSLIRTHQQLLKYYRSKGDRSTAAYFQKSIRQARWRYLKAWVSRKLKK